MPPLKKRIGVAVDLYGCPNRCRHCYLGAGPNGSLPIEFLEEASSAFWKWRGPGDGHPFFDQVDVQSWYREPDYPDNYRELHALEERLSRRMPRRWELLSIRRLAHDEPYARWAREHGPRTCQITFFGGRRVTDWFCRRRGAFDDNLAATERLLAQGMIPRWQIVLTKKGLPELSGLAALVDTMRLRERTAELGAPFDVFCHLPAPLGEGFNLEDIRIENDDLGLIPPTLKQSTEKHCGRIDWQAEPQIVRDVLGGAEIGPYEPDEQWFFINSDRDVFSNYGELTAPWRLGNLGREGVDAILSAFANDRPPAYQAAFHSSLRDLAMRFGRNDSRYLYAPGDLRARWVHLLCVD